MSDKELDEEGFKTYLNMTNDKDIKETEIDASIIARNSRMRSQGFERYRFGYSFKNLDTKLIEELLSTKLLVE